MKNTNYKTSDVSVEKGWDESHRTRKREIPKYGEW